MSKKFSRKKRFTGNLTSWLTNHFIIHIDFYIDKEFAARVSLKPDKLNPAAGIHMKPKEGKVTVVALCNVHGAWINEALL